MKTKLFIASIIAIAFSILLPSCVAYEPTPETFETEMEIGYRQTVGWSIARRAYDKKAVNMLERQVDKQYQKSLWQNSNIFFRLFPKPISHYPEKYDEAIEKVETYLPIIFSVISHCSGAKANWSIDFIEEILDVVSTAYLINDVEFENFRIIDEMYAGYTKKTIWEAVEINSGARVRYETYNDARIPSKITILDLDKAIAYVIDTVLDEEDEY